MGSSDARLTYEVPTAGSVDIDQEVYSELQASGLFQTMTLGADEVSPDALRACVSRLHVRGAGPHLIFWTSVSATLQAEHSLELHMPFIAHVFRQVWPLLA